MPLSSIAQITISLAAVAATRPGFGVPALFTPVTSPQAAAFGSDYGKVVTDADWQTVLTTLGFTESDDIWGAVSDLFSQQNTVSFALVARRATPVAQVYTYVVTSSDDGEYSITLDGQTASFTASGNTIEEIRDGLSAALAMLANASDFAFADVSTDSITATAAAAGLPFTTSVTGPATGDLTQTEDTPNTGISGDIANLRGQRDDWYAMVDVGHADSDILAGARTIETLEKFFMAQSSDSDVPNSATDDVVSVLQAESLVRTAVVYSSNIDQWVDSAWLGELLPTDPGSNNWAFQTLASVTGETVTTTEEQNLLAKNACWLERFEALDVSTTREGITPGGQYIDVIRGRDWLKANMRIDIFEALRQNPKIPYTDEGGEILGAVVRSRLEQAADFGLVERDTIVVTVPRKSAQSAADVSNRYFPGIEFSATLTGAINSVEVSGSLVP